MQFTRPVCKIINNNCSRGNSWNITFFLATLIGVFKSQSEHPRTKRRSRKKGKHDTNHTQQHNRLNERENHKLIILTEKGIFSVNFRLNHCKSWRVHHEVRPRIRWTVCVVMVFVGFSAFWAVVEISIRHRRIVLYAIHSWRGLAVRASAWWWLCGKLSFFSFQSRMLIIAC